MPQISPTEFYALPLRVHTFLADVPLHDVWAVDLPTRRDSVSLSDFLRRASQGGINRLPPVARALIRLRLFLGRIFRLETEPRDALAASFGNRLTPEDRARSFVVSGTPEGLFRVVLSKHELRLTKFATIFLRLALAAGFLAAVFDRFGLWGPPGTTNVAWGDFAHFLVYAAKLNPEFPASWMPAVGWTVTFAESVFAVTLLLGYRTRTFALLSALILLALGSRITIRTAIKSTLNA